MALRGFSKRIDWKRVARRLYATLQTEHMEPVERSAAVLRRLQPSRVSRLARATCNLPQSHCNSTSTARTEGALTWLLARLAAAMSELQSAREAFDALLAAKGSSEGA